MIAALAVLAGAGCADRVTQIYCQSAEQTKIETGNQPGNEAPQASVLIPYKVFPRRKHKMAGDEPSRITASLCISGHSTGLWDHFEKNIDTRDSVEQSSTALRAGSPAADAAGNPRTGSMGIGFSCVTDMSTLAGLDRKGFKKALKETHPAMKDIEANQLWEFFVFANGGGQYFWIKRGTRPLWLARRTSDYYFVRKAEEPEWHSHRIRYELSRHLPR